MGDQSIKLRYGQQKFLERMSKFLKENHDASITVTPMEYTDKEKEYLLFFEAKRKYYTRNNKSKAISEEDSMRIDKMSVKDSSFIHYLDKLVGDTAMFTIQEKCKYYLGEAIVNEKFTQLMKDRKEEFLNYFSDEEKARIKMLPSETIVPFNGFSYYKIEYNGEVPKKLQDAYDNINEINEENPKRPYLKRRNEDEGGTPVPGSKLLPSRK